MAQLPIDADNGLYYDYTPAAENGLTFVFFNALTGDTGMWRSHAAPALHQAGHGTLLWNYRGQADSPCPLGVALDAELIAADAGRLLREVAPGRPVMVGLSIGGLFAARAILAGAEASGLVFINTLRRPGPRLDWVNDAALRCATLGGLELVRDLFGALIFNEQWLAENRADAFPDRPYIPLTPEDGHYRLLNDCRGADWNVPYEQLQLPVLSISGLQDDMFLNLADRDAYLARMPQCRSVDIEDSGHMVPLERPQAFLDALTAFAAELST